ncbi:MAG: cytochrome P460 family protein [Candidatus Lambdaproteobacteria bacterium]|nr:cytochrome P460 family protein [Candidatus Lambdaproteobacteria bacterium]
MPANAMAAPAGAPPGPAGGPMTYGSDYASYEQVTGYVISAAHGNRYVVTYIYPPAAAELFRENAKLVRTGSGKGFNPYPVGTVLVQASWQKAPDGRPGPPAPLFLMKKEPDGFDPTGGDWRYGIARPGMVLVGDGIAGPVDFCKQCHAAAQVRDHVYAVDR